MEQGTVDRKVALQAFHNVNFRWADILKPEADGKRYDIPGINSGARIALETRLKQLKADPDGQTALVMPIIGNAGSGKTHLLNGLRELTAREGGFFIPADMTNLKDFHATVNAAALDSLVAKPASGRQPLAALLNNIMIEAGTEPLAPEREGGSVPSIPAPELKNALSAARNGLHRKHRIKFRDAMTALEAVFALASEDMEENYRGRSLLTGEWSPEGTVPARPKGGAAALSGLTWLMSLNGGFTVLAIDQLDAILAKLHEDISNATRLAIVSKLSKELGDFHSATSKTLPVVTLVPEVWGRLEELGIKSSMGRFNNPSFL
ncbi:MAG: ATP-binding protein, partial [Deltaproteobacteria bacterium]|nr:ATP-binding protein [Deltaproteobacteria bacterium]